MRYCLRCAHWGQRPDINGVEDEPVSALSDHNIHKRVVVALLVEEAHLAVLMGLLTLAKVDNLSVLRISVLLVSLLRLKLSLDQVHLSKPGVGDRVLTHRGVLHPDPHQQIPLLHKHLFV